jgi:glucose-1-phosphate thymidylyltransferase
MSPTPITKAVILARGHGSRMRASHPDVSLSPEQQRAADAGLKGMIPIDRPFLDYVLSGLVDAGIPNVCLVIGPEHGDIRRYYAFDITMTRTRLQFAVQAEALGTANAVASAQTFVGTDSFLVLNADNYYPVEAYRQLARLGGNGLVGFDRNALVAESNIPEERIRAFALVETNSAGELASITEKPDAATYERLAARALVSMNLWSFTPDIFEACARTRPSPRGELELQDAVRIARDELGQRFQVVPFAGGVLDLSHREDIPAVARSLAGVRVSL